ncbi:NADH-quinone oxidoreductase subunit NuoE [Heliobacterium gestii]|uniref:NADH-quinone oxidoreductase subunit NuoE n=1 Tax=Heliomicrobium gestii TaxID=2699 RepID=A0A845LD17_HELGE|nr:NADH-quinone oxidoreductase subunit NuoE [Heliomicrobium gestii]MBM7866144.1 NADH-quinone oxidoreductase subunit E [Heliomicrobium gestii]MZP42529.1 NADH-quinone oxidoreductase subunit NuoE [Heliomicrobium gestii]
MVECHCCQEHVETEKDQRLTALLAEYREARGALIPLLQGAQEIYGYLPEPVMERIARSLRLPVAQVYGVATFYAQFHFAPRGRHVIRVCLGTACHVRGGARIFEALRRQLEVEDGETTPDLRYTLESVACIGACGLAPVIMIDEDTHGRLTPESLPTILARYE